jgi:hypothetical protein
MSGKFVFFIASCTLCIGVGAEGGINRACTCKMAFSSLVIQITISYRRPLSTLLHDSKSAGNVVGDCERTIQLTDHGLSVYSYSWLQKKNGKQKCF